MTNLLETPQKVSHCYISVMMSMSYTQRNQKYCYIRTESVQCLVLNAVVPLCHVIYSIYQLWWVCPIHRGTRSIATSELKVFNVWYWMLLFLSIMSSTVYIERLNWYLFDIFHQCNFDSCQLTVVKQISQNCEIRNLLH